MATFTSYNKLGVVVSSGCYNKTLQTRQLIKNRFTSHGLEAGKAKIEVLADSVPGGSQLSGL